MQAAPTDPVGVDEIELEEVGQQEEYRFDEPSSSVVKNANVQYQEDDIEIEAEYNPKPVQPATNLEKMESVDLEDPYKEEKVDKQ